MSTHFNPPLSPNDSLVHYGDGLFETMLAVGGRVINLDYHFARLQNGCARLDIACPSQEALDDALKNDLTLRTATNEQTHVVKLILSRGTALRGYQSAQETDSFAYLFVNSLTLSEPTPKTLVVSPISLSKQPLLAGLKHSNRLEQIMAKRQLPDFADEAIMLDTDGAVIETISHNLFWRSEMGWHTPALDQSGVAGTLRAHILNSALKHGIPVQVESYTLDDLRHAKNIFLTNAVAGIVPVTKLIDKTELVSKNHDITFSFDKLAIYTLCRHITHPCLNFYSDCL